jgi:hypothetical protein
MLRKKGFQGLWVHTDSHKCRAYFGPPARDLILAIPLLIFLTLPGHATEDKRSHEEAQFDIFVAGRKIGQEKFSIQNSPDSVRSNSILDFQDPGNQHQKVTMETQLDMDSKYVPRAYRLQTDIDGQKGAVYGKFVAGEATFEYQENGNARKRGLLVGDHYIVLDTNVFHHFIFIARLFDFSSNRPQSIEVVIPQELDNGLIKVSEVGVEKISVSGKKKNLHHLRADSGLLVIDLWVDDQRILYKIALPAKGIEVIRNR